MLVVEHVAFSYGFSFTLQDISFDIKKGEILGILGPNGAGKTTLLNLITGLLKPNHGSILIDDQDIQRNSKKVRKKIGLVPQEIALYEELSGWENLLFWANIYSVNKKIRKDICRDLAEVVGLTANIKRKVKTYSGGMKRRLNLAVGMIHNPPLLLLDEPTVGIDPQARYKMLKIIKQKRDNGTAVLYTTHYLEEAEKLCDRICIIDDGRIIAQGSLETLTNLISTSHILSITGQFSTKIVSEVISNINGANIIYLQSDRIVLNLDRDFSIQKLIVDLSTKGIKFEKISIQPPSLQSVFLKLTGKEFRD